MLVVTVYCQNKYYIKLTDFIKKQQICSHKKKIVQILLFSINRKIIKRQLKFERFENIYFASYVQNKN